MRNSSTFHPYIHQLPSFILHSIEQYQGDVLKQKRLGAIAVASGILCAVCMALFMFSLQRQAEDEHAQMLARYGGEQVEACIATRDIAAGERLDASSLETRLWVASLLPDDAICDSSEALGQVATTSILKGEVIVSKRFYKDAADLDIPAGCQAVSVPVKAVQAVGGSIQAGMRVDVYATGDTSTTEFGENVLVLDTSIGDSESLTSSGNGWITLAIESQRVQEMVAAANKTDLYFAVPSEDVASAQQNSNANEERSTKKEDNDVASNSPMSR